MINNEKHYDLIKFEDGDFSLDVKVSPNEDTVWLSQKEMSLLFDVSTDNIGLHIKNILNEGELDPSTTEESSVVQFEANRHVKRTIKLFNLDMIISVGYRVKSKRGIIFRRWATSTLKQYLLKGHVINEERCLSCTSNILDLQSKYKEIKNKVNNLNEIVYSDNNKLFYEGEILEPYSFLIKLFFLAKNKLTIIDMYADSFLLKMLEEIKIPIYIYTSSNSYLNNIDLKANIHLINTNVFHDRYIIVDETVYMMGTSFNSIGKKRFTLTKLIDIKEDDLLKK